MGRDRSWALAAAALAFVTSRSRRSRSSSSSSSALPRATRTYHRGREEWTRDTFAGVAGALHDTIVPRSLHALAAAAITAVAAHDCGFGDNEWNNNPFNLHASSGDRVRAGREVLAAFSSREAGILAAVRALEGERYRGALAALAQRLEALPPSSGTVRLEQFKDAAADFWRDLAENGWFSTETARAHRAEHRTIAGGVYGRLRNAGLLEG